ncbi:acyl-CoA synthetase (NDP forming) [Naumannella cuiyingiana]|uniref:Acyl-CoA synthetase (NDP forming) n=1 Tax=Naumannella cuiyingiana TaxID=1347891 RepID=A0A7Z0D6H8_9ACTN|nr:acetate--CoA ligase family protein [Naumannella cuiyingiana]NYI69807.1 acyl-CoA synthetase (NDP forming) [Naumannella cuiyingiana]
MTVEEITEVPAEFTARLNELFRPRGIAMIGATDKSRWSVNVLQNLERYEFAGPIHLVNPRGGQVHGRQAYSSIAELPDGVDMAFVMVPTRAVLDTMTALADRGIRTAVVLTAGFGELGEEGAALERQLADLCRERGLVIVGPNGNGFIHAAAGVVPFGMPISPPLLRGSVGFVLQSGALASYVLHFAQARRVGISLLVAMGNETVLGLTDVVRYLIADPDTKVICLFLESIREPEEFRQACAEARAAGKPIVAVKVGRSSVGASVARAHTGSLVGDERVTDAALKQLGVIRVPSLEDLVITADLLTRLRDSTAGRRVGVVTGSGGACELLADVAEDVGIDLVEFTPETVAELQSFLPEFATVHNPIDVTGYVLVDPTLMAHSLEVVSRDANVDLALMITDAVRESSPADDLIEESMRRNAAIVRASDKPVELMSTTLLDITPFTREMAERADYPPTVGGIEHGIRALGRAIDWLEWVRSDEAATAPAAPPAVPVPDGVAGQTWTEHAASAYLAEHGVPMVPSRLVGGADEALAAAQELGFPVVLKLAADDIAHKSDIGGVRLNITDEATLREAYAGVEQAGRTAGVDPVTVLVQPQRSGLELIVGIATDPTWGKVLAVGLGGIWVEIMKDSALRVLPATREQIRAAFEELRAAPLLHGARGAAAVDLDALVEAVYRLGELAVGLGPAVDSIELNPLLATPEGVEAVDALITWA